MKDAISIKRIEQLHPKVRDLFHNFVEECETIFKTTFRVVQGYRTFAEQDALYNQPHDHKDNDGDGKIDELDERVTNAPGGKSFHNYGIAIDIVEMIDGKTVNWNFDYSKLKPIADKYGLEWGGAWVSIVDKPHFQKTFGLTIQQLYKKYLGKDFIPGTQYLNI